MPDHDDSDDFGERKKNVDEENDDQQQAHYQQDNPDSDSDPFGYAREVGDNEFDFDNDEADDKSTEVVEAFNPHVQV